MKYKVGDKVLVRQWDDMKQEFGVDYDGIIQTPYFVFSEKWKHICGTVQEIANVGLAFYMFKGINIRVFTDDMIERKVNEMTKADLKTGHIVTIRDGTEYVVFTNTDVGYTDGNDFLLNDEYASWFSMIRYNDDLTYKDNKHEYDIMKVEKPSHPYAIQDMNYERDKRIVLWEREETKELTVAEVEKLLGCKVKIVDK